ncbi:MAG: phosphoribosyltransferase, partial [Frankiaceae bacterium]
MLFSDRNEAGRRLAEKLAGLRRQDVVVVGLPRGGVPVAAEVAKGLDADLDVIVVRKLGVPYQRELAFGAVGEDGVMVFNRDVVELAGLTEQQIAEVVTRERAEVARRAERLRGRPARVPLAGRTVVIVDDGIATGATARVACQVARTHGAARVVLAVPVGPPDVEVRLRSDADAVVCLHTPPEFFAVGQFYRDFPQLSDDAVVALLRAGPPTAAALAAVAVVDEDVPVDAGPVPLAGHLTVPVHARGVVVFAHGSGSSRHSPRNRHVAAVLNRARLATLLVDLL